MSRRPRRTVQDRRQAVQTAWAAFEDQDPDISTERLMAMVADATGEDFGDIGWLVEDGGQPA